MQKRTKDKKVKDKIISSRKRYHEKNPSFAQIQKKKMSREEESTKLGFIQVADIEKVSAEEIENSFNDKPNNNIVRITGVQDNANNHESTAAFIRAVDAQKVIWEKGSYMWKMSSV